MSTLSILEAMRQTYSSVDNASLEPLLPLLLRINGKPFTLDKHKPFSPVFMKYLPRRLVLRTGRQVGKSTSLSSLTLIRAWSIPGHKIMIATPLKNQAANLSNTYLKHFVNTSPLKEKFVDGSCTQATFYKDFTNQSRVVFSYAHDDAQRIRSYTNDFLILDEVQDFNAELLPVLIETLTASDWRMVMFAGTPLTFNNTLENLWLESSQNEFVIKCASCSKWNIPTMDHHILRMIGDPRTDCSESEPCIICAYCGRPLKQPLLHGEWVAKYPERMTLFAGYHIPQIIMPMHYADYERWCELIDKREGKGPTPWYRFVNEVLGEAWESSTLLISDKDLRSASILGDNVPSEVSDKRNNYVRSCIAIDWGGGGQANVSFTTICFAGMRPDGVIEIPFGKKICSESSIQDEVREVFYYCQLFMPDFLVHDYTGGGTVREALMLQMGVDFLPIVSIVFVGNSPNYVMIPSYSTQRGKQYYKVDRTKGIQLVCSAIRAKSVVFFRGELGEGQRLLDDYKNIIEERRLTRLGKETYYISKKKDTCDDFVSASVLACVCLWKATGNWPRIAVANTDAAFDFCPRDDVDVDVDLNLDRES